MRGLSKSTKTTRFHEKENDRKKKAFGIAGSFTVEAALLMSLIIPVLAALIYGAFYVHDTAVLQGIVCELAVMGSNLAQEKNQEGELEKRKKELISSRFTGTGKVTVSVKSDVRKTAASGSGEFCFPGLVMKFFGGNIRKISVNWEKELIHPADKIRKVRGLEYLADTVKG